MQGIAVLALFFFSFFNLRKTPTPDSFAASISLFFLPLTRATLLGTLSTWRSLHISIDTCPTFCGMLCCYSGIILGCEQDCTFCTFVLFPARPHQTHPPSHPRPTFNQALRRRIPQSAYLMGCYRFFCQPKITHSGPMCSRRTTLSGHSTWASPNNNHHPSSSTVRPPEQLPRKETLNPVHWILRLTVNHYQLILRAPVALFAKSWHLPACRFCAQLLLVRLPPGNAPLSTRLAA